jgi:methyl-galactoside transport system substrate-binding protein
MKKLAKTAAIFLALCLLAACAQGSPKAAFFLYKGDDTFIAEMIASITERLPPEVAYEVREAGNSQAVQNQQIVELIDGGYDLFVVNAVDRLACSAIVEKCAQKGLPVIFFNREPQADALSGSDVYYVGAAADSLGRKQADMVDGLFAGDFAGSKYDRNGDGVVQTVILKGEQGHQDAEKRTDNCVARLRELGYSVEVLAMEAADWNRRDGFEAMRRIYREHGENIELVFSNNDDMALGAIDYLLETGVFAEGRQGEAYAQPFVVVGVDGTAVGLEAIGQGLLYGTVNNDSAKQSDAILLLSELIVKGEGLGGFPYPVTNGHYVYIDGDIITLENLVGYIG